MQNSLFDTTWFRFERIELVAQILLLFFFQHLCYCWKVKTIGGEKETNWSWKFPNSEISQNNVHNNQLTRKQKKTYIADWTFL